MFKVGQKLKTRDGRDARVICVDRKHELYPVMALVADSFGHETMHSFEEDGRFCNSGNGCLDLMPPTEKREGWLNVYRSKPSGRDHTSTKMFESKEVADACAASDRIACVRIEYEAPVE